MNNTAICPCGIHRDDCDYHKPAPESEPDTLRYSAYPDSEAPTHRFLTADGTWYSAICFKDDKLEDLKKVAKQIGDYREAQVIKALVDAYGVS